MKKRISVLCASIMVASDAIAVHIGVQNLIPNLCGLAVIDVVEGMINLVTHLRA